MNRIHVLYSFPLRLGVTGGTAMTAWQQVHGLLRQGVRVSLFCGSCERRLEGLDALRETLKPLGLKLPVRMFGRQKAKALHDGIVARAIRRIHNRSKIDVVHCWPSGSLETLRAARELRIKTMLERPSAHTLYVYEVTKSECERLKIAINKSHYSSYDNTILAREEKEFRSADKLLCPSEFVVKTFIEKGFRKEQLVRHRYGYDPAYFKLDKPQPTGKDNPSFDVVYVGECSPLKGLHFALRAWVKSAASKNGKFCICGKIVSGYKQFVKQFLVHPSVEYLGFRRDVAEVMRNSNALILSSLGEGSALVTYEARACGCVLLVSEASGACCRHMHDALVHKVGDVDSLRQHIDMLASDKRLYQRLRNNSLAGLDQLTWEKAAERLVEIYREILGSTGNIKHEVIFDRYS